MDTTSVCPLCCQPFLCGETERRRRDDKLMLYTGVSLPLLLSCGHTFCEGCLQKLAKQEEEKTIECPTCKSVTPLASDGSITELCPDLVSLGEMSVSTKHRYPTPSSIYRDMLSDDVMDPASSSPEGLDAERCAECSGHATCSCLRCGSDLCENCFNKIHSKSKALKTHNPTPLYEDESVRKQMICSVHTERLLDFYCDDCATTVCSHCVITGEHSGHKITAMEEMNKSAMEEIESAVAEATKTWRRLSKVQQRISELKSSIRSDVQNVAQEIRGKFKQLHAVLLVREMALLSQVAETHENETRPLVEMDQKVRGDINKIERIVRDKRNLDADQAQRAVNAQRVVKRLRDVTSVPCILQTVESDQRLRLKFSDGLLETLKSTGCIEGFSSVRTDLKLASDVSEADLPDITGDSSEIPPKALPKFPVSPKLKSNPSVESRHNIERSSARDEKLTHCDVISEGGNFKDDDSTCYDVISDRSSVCSEHSTSDVSTSSTTALMAGLKCGALKRITFKKSHRVKVHMSHIRHPGHFFVHRLCDLEKIRTISMTISLWAITPRGMKEIPTQLKFGQLIIARWPGDDKWYRGQVIEYKHVDDVRAKTAQVRFIDHGNVAWLPYQSLRVMPRVFSSEPELAVLCALWDIVPSSEEKQQLTHWSNESIREFVKLCADKTLLLTVLEDSEDIVQVDLSKPQDECLEYDVPVSMRETLVFLEHACYMHEKSVTTPSRMSRSFIPPELPLKNSRHDVMTCHLETPHSFYVQRMGEQAHYLARMMTELQIKYKKVKGDLWTIFCPQMGQMCVAEFSSDGSWYRGEVVGLPGRRRVMIRYVDFGNVEIVPYWKLRKISGEFVKLPVMAFHCSMADVAPVDGETEWRPEAKVLLEQIMQKQMIATVRGSVGRTLQIVLHTQEGQCVNSLLVKQGLASSTGVMSRESHEQLEAYKRQIAVRGRGGISGGSPHQMAPAVRGGIPGETPHQMTPVVREGGEYKVDPVKRIAALFKETPGPDKPANLPCLDTTTNEGLEPEEKQTKPRVVISHVISPGHFYIQSEDSTEKLNKLMMEMQDFYANGQQTAMSWNQGDRCAAQLTRGDRWYRVKILSRIDEQSVEVRATDYGYQEVVPISGLRPLAVEHEAPLPFCLRCHVSNLVPAGTGDATLWSQTSNELLQLLQASHSVFSFQHQGLLENGSLPIDLIYEQHTAGNALSADCLERKSVCRLFVSKGLALPKRVLRLKSANKEVDNNSSSEKESSPVLLNEFFGKAEKSGSNSKQTESAGTESTSVEADGIKPFVHIEPSAKIDPTKPPETEDLNTTETVPTSLDEIKIKPTFETETLSILAEQTDKTETSEKLESALPDNVDTGDSKNSAQSFDDVSLEAEQNSDSRGGGDVTERVKSSGNVVDLVDQKDEDKSLAERNKTVGESSISEGNTLGRLKTAAGCTSVDKGPARSAMVTKSGDSPSKSRPQRLVPSGVRTEAFFRNLPGKHREATPKIERFLERETTDECWGREATTTKDSAIDKNVSYEKAMTVTDCVAELTVGSSIEQDVTASVTSVLPGSNGEDCSTENTSSATPVTLEFEQRTKNIQAQFHQLLVKVVSPTKKNVENHGGLIKVNACTEDLLNDELMIKPDEKSPAVAICDESDQSSMKTLKQTWKNVGPKVTCDPFLDRSGVAMKNSQSPIEPSAEVNEVFKPLEVEGETVLQDETGHDGEDRTVPLLMQNLKLTIPTTSNVVAPTRLDFERPLEWKPAEIPDSVFKAVPSYVDFDGIISAQIVYEATSLKGRLGFLLKENTLETVIQNEWLSRRGLHRAHIPRDGNCLFRAFAEALDGDQSKHETLRKNAVQTILKTWDKFNMYIQGKADDYASTMRQDGAYGGEAEIKALCWLYNVKAIVYMGGLNYPVSTREYGKLTELQVVELIYISDGNYDSGHYDLVVRSPDRLAQIEEKYDMWRTCKKTELHDFCRDSDDTHYDDSLLGQLMSFIQKYCLNKQLGKGTESVVNSSDSPVKQVEYKIGQPVLARYTLDDEFYRATVQEILNEKYKVLYIDFGNSEWIGASDIICDVVLLEIPIQRVCCTLAGVRPAQGVWSTPVLNEFHALVVGKMCRFEIQDRVVPGSPVQVRVTLPDCPDVTKQLLNLEAAVQEGAALQTATNDLMPAPKQHTQHGAEFEDWEGVEFREEFDLSGSGAQIGQSGRNHTTAQDAEDWDGHQTAVRKLDVDYQDYGIDDPTVVPDRTVPSPYRQLVLECDTNYLMLLTQLDHPDTVYLQHTKEQVEIGEILGQDLVHGDIYKEIRRKVEQPDSEQKPEQPDSEQKPEQPNSEQKAEQPDSEQSPEQPNSEQKPEQLNLEQKPEQPNSEQKSEQPNSEQKSEQPNSEQKSEQPNSEQKPEQNGAHGLMLGHPGVELGDKNENSGSDLCTSEGSSVDDEDDIELKWLHEGDGSSGRELRNKMLNELIRMSEVLFKEADNYRKLETVKPGSACVCDYSLDGCSYRAEVISIHHPSAACINRPCAARSASVTVPGGRQPLVGIRYVDYGSCEYVTPDRLREIPKKLMDLPTQSVRVKIADLVPTRSTDGATGAEGLVPGEAIGGNTVGDIGGSTKWDPCVEREMARLCAERSLLVIVKSVDPDILVEILDYDSARKRKDGILTLVYQPLIDEGIVRLCHEEVVDQNATAEDDYVILENDDVIIEEERIICEEEDDL